jgi:hypothetical protein
MYCKKRIFIYEVMSLYEWKIPHWKPGSRWKNIESSYEEGGYENATVL